MDSEYSEDQMVAIIQYYVRTTYPNETSGTASARQSRVLVKMVNKFIRSGNVASLFLAWSASGKLDGIFEQLKQNPDFIKQQLH